MKTFMLGWEFPPYITGGLGTACHGLTKAMDKLGIEIVFVLPKSSQTSHSSHVKLLSAEGDVETKELSEFKNVRFRTIISPLKPYVASETFEASNKRKSSNHTRSWHCNPSKNLQNYGCDIYEQVHRYAQKAAEIASIEDFDIIHAHDWMTYPAGIAIAQISDKPLIVHVHSTEFDRSGEHINQMIYDVERQGMQAAAKVIAVSNFTKSIIVRHYSVPPEKVEVVHNGVECDGSESSRPLPQKSDKIVLFLGRITMQKGPEYFLAAAKRVLEAINNVKFIMAGNGDMMHRIIEFAAQLGIGNKVLFAGFLQGDDVNKVYQMADLYVMPSVSEPFGIAPLEAMRQNVPVLISKQSGIAEAVVHALKVDFWDINEMANKIIAVLKRPPLQTTLRRNGFSEAHKFRWEDAALKVKKIYGEALALMQTGVN